MEKAKILKFITGNKNKFKEMSEYLAPFKIGQKNIDLDEVQELDTKKVMLHKLKEALKHQKTNFFIEDTSVIFLGMGKKLPGTFIKWFLHELGPFGLYELAQKLDNKKAIFKTVIGYVNGSKQIHLFEGVVKGQMVKPRGKGGFGLDPIFLPDHRTQTSAELKSKNIFNHSSRYRAAIKFKNYLLKNAGKKLKN